MKAHNLTFIFIASAIYALYNATPEAPETAEFNASIATIQAPVAPGEEYEAFCRTEPLSTSCTPEF